MRQTPILLSFSAMSSSNLCYSLQTASVVSSASAPNYSIGSKGLLYVPFFSEKVFGSSSNGGGRSRGRGRGECSDPHFRVVAVLQGVLCRADHGGRGPLRDAEWGHGG